MKRAGREPGNLSVVTPFQGGPPEPPGELTKEQAKHWRAIVATKPSDWFQSDSFPLLMAYCRDIVEAERVSQMVDSFDTEWLAEHDGLERYKQLISIRDKINGRMAQYATKMRLTQSSNTRADAAESANRRAKGKRPWEQTA